jgi:hypothetical protein
VVFLPPSTRECCLLAVLCCWLSGEQGEVLPNFAQVLMCLNSDASGPFFPHPITRSALHHLHTNLNTAIITRGNSTNLHPLGRVPLLSAGLPVRGLMGDTTVRYPERACLPGDSMWVFSLPPSTRECCLLAVLCCWLSGEQGEVLSNFAQVLMGLNSYTVRHTIQLRDRLPSNKSVTTRGVENKLACELFRHFSQRGLACQKSLGVVSRLTSIVLCIGLQGMWVSSLPPSTGECCLLAVLCCWLS